MTRLVDLPPLWTILHIAVLWLLPGPGAGRTGDVIGAGLIAIGLSLMLWAAAVMLARRTPVMPGEMPEALVTTGPFRFSRNPIYLGDVLVLAGAALWVGPWWGLILVPVLMWVLTARFIRPEEARLRARILLRPQFLARVGHELFDCHFAVAEAMDKG